MRILLDTCALLWWTLDPKKINLKALNTLNQQEILWVNSISIWEIGLKVKNQKLDIGMPIETFVAELKKLNMLEIVPINTQLWLANLALSWEHRDPADRTIVATAKELNAHIATTDQTMIAYYDHIFKLN